MPKKHIPLDRLTPIKATEKKLHSPKAWIFLWLSLIAYGLIFFRLFEQFFALESMIYVLFFFLFFHFFYLEVRKLPIKYLAIFMLVITVIQWFFIGYSHILLVASILSINVGIVYLARLLQGSSYDKISRDSTSYFTTGWYMFTVFITIAYNLFIIGYYEKFPFTCESLNTASNSVIDFVAKPFKLGLEEAKHMKENTELFFNSKVTDLKAIEIENGAKDTTFIGKLNEYKKSRVDQAIKDNTTVNMGICDYVLWEIVRIYEQPGFKASVIVLMFLLFYGFIRIEFWIMTGIAIILFRILYMLKVYRVKKVMKEVEELE